MPNKLDKRSALAKLDRSGNGCWEWPGTPSLQGYGRVMIGGKSILAHRLVYEAEVGLVPVGMQIDHLCLNRMCARPDHLEAVTQKENILRGLSAPAWNAEKGLCVRGHELTGSNLFPSNRNERACRACDKIRKQEAAARKKAA